MAKVGVAPIPDPLRGIEALQADLAKVLPARSLSDAGWAHPDPLTLFVPMWAKQSESLSDFYLLRLMFFCYPEWPPSALFVNPATLAYTITTDKKWLPRIEGCNEIAVHENYKNTGQLICASVTLEFYQVLHSVNPEHLWDEEKQNFSATLAAIRFGLNSPFYKGPMEARA